MRAGPSKALALMILLSGCSRPVPQYSDASVATVIDAASPLLRCTLPLDPEMAHDQIIADECFEDFFGGCRKTCVQTCVTCGENCTTEKCRADCLAARDDCARAQSGHCASTYRECRTKLVTDWLANKCDAVCAPFRKCPECDAGAKAAACVPARCDAMQSAAERKVLDPKWKANQCDAVCTKIWACAEADCEKAPGCIEPIKKYEACALRIPGTVACGLRDGASTLLCTEPQ